jgi:hypothetical protein
MESSENKVSVKKDFFDEDGEFSYYVKNTSEGNVLITDLKVLVPMLGATDLRERHNVETLKKSPDLRRALSPQVHWLKKISREEYEKINTLQSKRLERSAEQKKKAIQDVESKAVADTTGKVKETQKIKVSPKVQSMVEKLRLTFRGEDSAITKEDFLSFVDSVKLNADERSYILGVISDADVRDALNKKSEEESKQ